jgi:subtilase-type serine protease
MTQDASQFPWKTYFAKPQGSKKYRYVLAAVATASFLSASQAALAEAISWASAKRKDHPLSLALWSPPPGDIRWIHDEAQLGPPDAPFVFSGDTLYSAASFTSTRPFLIDQQAHVHTAGDTVFRLDGPISNLGASRQGLVKRGTGTLVLSGSNSYQGNTLLQQGTLRVQGNSALGQTYRTLDMYQGTTLDYAPDAIVYNAVQLRYDTEGYAAEAPADYAGSVQWRVDEGSATQAGIVNGSVPIVKQGLGTLRMLGFVTNPASATVNQGTLAIEDFFGGAIQVNAGARLEGHGTIGSAVVRGGATLAPRIDGGMATLGVLGDLQFQPGARLELRVDASGRSDTIQVMGRAMLHGKVMALAQAGDWKPGTRYTVLQAGLGFEGTRFESAHTNLPFLDPTLSYDAQKVYLTLDRNDTPLDEVADTPTEDDTADAIDGDNPGLHDQIIVMDREQAKEAFRQLSGSWHASVLSGLAEDSRHVRQAALQHALPEPLAQARSGARFWQHSFHASADRGSQDGTPGDTRDLGGMVAGVTRPVGDSWHIGALAGAQHSRASRTADMADARIDSVHAGATLAGRWRSADLIVGAAHSWHTINSRRNIAVADLRDALSGNYRARTLQLFTEIAAPLRWLAHSKGRLPARTRVEPFLRLAWVKTDVQNHTEDGGPAALNTSAASHRLAIAMVGLKAAHIIETAQGALRLYGMAAWRQAAGDVRSLSRQSFRDGSRQQVFESEGQPVARQAWALRLGMDAAAARNLKIGIAYAGQFARRRQEHGARLDISWAF